MKKLNLSSSLVQKVSLNQTGSNIDTFNGVSIDTRTIEAGALFVPIIGDRFDGHQFLEAAIEGGASGTFWQKGVPLPDMLPNDFPVYFVEDTLEALQQLAEAYKKQVGPTVIAVTGSNGKTTTKDMIASVLGERLNVHKTEGNYNNHIGLPLTVLRMQEDTDVLICEMGMNHKGEISFLSELVEPHYGVITNIGESHMEQLGSREGIAEAKGEITDGMKASGVLILDGDEMLLNREWKTSVIECGFHEEALFYAHSIQNTPQGVTFTVKGIPEAFELPVLGAHNVKNALYAIALGAHLGLTDEDARNGLKNLTVTSMRMEQLTAETGALLINDAYNASPTSMKAAIETVKVMEDYSRKVVVLGDMLELGVHEKTLHESVASACVGTAMNVVTIGEKAFWIAEALKSRKDDTLNIEHYENKKQAMKRLQHFNAPDTVFLFKASRGMEFEQLIEQLIHS